MTVEARQWLDEIMREVDSVDPTMMAPLEERRPNEKVICTVTDPTLRKLFILGLIYRRDQKRAEVDFQYEKNQSAMQLQIRSFDRAHLCFALFWAAVHETFDIWKLESIGLRSDWTIVEVPSFPNPLLKLFGVDPEAS